MRMLCVAVALIGMALLLNQVLPAGEAGANDPLVWTIYEAYDASSPGDPKPNLQPESDGAAVGEAKLRIGTDGRLRVDVTLDAAEADTEFLTFVVSWRVWGQPAETYELLETDADGEGSVKLVYDVPTHLLGDTQVRVKVDLRSDWAPAGLPGDTINYTTGSDWVPIPAAWQPTKLMLYVAEDVSAPGGRPAFEPVPAADVVGFVTYSFDEDEVLHLNLKLKDAEPGLDLIGFAVPRGTWGGPPAGAWFETNKTGRGSLQLRLESLVALGETVRLKVNARTDDEGDLVAYSTGLVRIQGP